MKRMTIGLAALLAGCTGCLAGKDATFEQKQASQRQFVQKVKDGKFKGRAWFRGAGSPIGFHMTNSFELGPQQADMGFEGEMDFSGPPNP